MSTSPKLVIFLVMDTARYSSFDFNSDLVNPYLNSFIKNHEALNFKRAISAAPWTIPSHVSMFTGKLPSEHRCIDYGFTNIKMPRSPKSGKMNDKLCNLGYY